jgi:putative ABC transport system permease protein
MFGICLRRELGRRKKAALVVAMGLALGIALVITVNSVSAGMRQAQNTVLKSLYGLGTDMTVTKAMSAASGGSSQRPDFKFDAKSNSSTQQSSDRVMTQGGQTLKSSLVQEVAAQKGVAGAVGALSLNVTKVDGSFTQGKAKTSTSGGSQQGGPGDAGRPQVQVGGAQPHTDADRSEERRDRPRRPRHGRQEAPRHGQRDGQRDGRQGGQQDARWYDGQAYGQVR